MYYHAVFIVKLLFVAKDFNAIYCSGICIA